jgi:alkylation response protein AidB-like acyl-CoA dehydrogenase
MPEQLLEQLLAEVRQWRPVVRERIAEMEQRGDILPELLAWLRERRLFKLFVPKEFGGLEFTLTAAVRLYEELAALDGSLGWLVQIGAGGGFFVPSFPPEVARELFAPPEAVIAGTSYVGGRARRLPKGFCVSGYWRYASGAAYATLFTAQAEVEGEGIAAFAFRREEVTLIPEWEPLGMRATSSWSFEVRELVVPPERCFRVGQRLWEPGLSVYALPFSLFAYASIGAVAVGLARALAEEAELLGCGRFVQACAQELAEIRARFFELVAWAEGLSPESSPARAAELEREIAALLEQLRMSLLRAMPLLGMRAVLRPYALERLLRDLLTLYQHELLRMWWG